MKLLKLSKVVSAAVPMVEIRPPFGASGLTQAKCVKSGAYLRSPNADRPCRPLSARAVLDRQAHKATHVKELSRLGISWSASLANSICRACPPAALRRHRHTTTPA